MEFSRTTAGKAAYYRFVTEPLVWVEGVEDVEVFMPLARQYRFLLKSAGGKLEAAKLAIELKTNEYPYVVVLDGDYSILRRSRSIHRRVVVLRRHSMENYLTEREPLETLCSALNRRETDEESLNLLYDEALLEVESKLKGLIILDIAQNLCKLGIAVLPNALEEIFANDRTFDISGDLVFRRMQAFVHLIDAKCIEQANVLLDHYLLSNPFIHALKGHLIWGLLRRLIAVVSRKSDHKFQADHRTLRIALAPLVWKRKTSPDHEKFIDQLSRAVKESRDLRSRSTS